MRNNPQFQLISLFLTCALAILTTEAVAVLIFEHSPQLKSKMMVAFWWILQAIGGIIFSKVSDKHYRRKTLIICQLFGILSGVILLYFKLNILFLIIIALTFNPLPVARAALLDNFPNQSTIRIIGATYFLKYTPWLLSDLIGGVEYSTAVQAVFLSLVISAILTAVLFKDPYDKTLREEAKKKPVSWLSIYVILILVAFIFSEQTFYIEWDEFEHFTKFRSSFPLVTFGTLAGISIATIYPKLTHVSLVTICYMIGVATIGSVLFQYYMTGNFTSFSTLTISMNFYAILGGMYLPLFTNLIIHALGNERRAFGSALAESGEAVASMFAALTSYLTEFTPVKMSIVFLILYTLASFLQKYSEKHYPRKSI